MESREPESQYSEYGRFRSLRPIILAAIAIVAALIAGGTTYAFAANHKDGKVAEVQVSTTSRPVAVTESTSAPSTTTSTTAVTVPPAAELPPFAYATSSLNRIVAVNTTTGKTDKVLKSYPALDDPKATCNAPSSLAMSPDRKTLYYTQSTPGKDYNCDSEVRAMSVDGVDEGRVANNASDPAISPDGKQMVFARTTTTPQGNYDLSIVIMDIASKSERVVKKFENNVYGGMHASWSPDENTVVYQPAVCGCGDFAWLDMYSLDVKSGSERTLLTQTTDNNGRFYSFPNYLPDGSIAALEQGGIQYGDEKIDKSGRIVALDANSGKVLRSITSLNTGSYYDVLAVDAAGTHFTFISDNALMKYTVGETPKGFAYGVWHVAW